MTKEQYLELFTKPEIPMDIWYEFFLERGGAQIGMELFARVFGIVTQPGGTMVTGSNGQPKWISMESCYKNFYQYYQQKFEL